ncbi:MAG: hypothetical protein JSS14_22030 [Proteobacteria bacterium]|nr:hypothetical protein [Pseudomonadota bacterium]
MNHPYTRTVDGNIAMPEVGEFIIDPYTKTELTVWPHIGCDGAIVKCVFSSGINHDFCHQCTVVARNGDLTHPVIWVDRETYALARLTGAHK